MISVDRNSGEMEKKLHGPKHVVLAIEVFIRSSQMKINTLWSLVYCSPLNFPTNSCLNTEIWIYPIFKFLTLYFDLSNFALRYPSFASYYFLCIQVRCWPQNAWHKFQPYKTRKERLSLQVVLFDWSIQSDRNLPFHFRNSCCSLIS